uniref:Integrase, catalytic region, zinc finger, CCHC-type, peptidase aspartic, catalytic n=1 Tax=Tanacetum cinerariifolium TaxID=118510 RepID=A0A6L2KAI4_TANCI|nr:integrase, catalytic region, zinc finger, CCHC-type, peptidase aspartic, catalytic [Tanacetum cinerariifolium]
MWSDQEKRIQKIDHLARPLLIQGLPNDIYSFVDSNKTAKELWDALARHMLGSEYGEQDRKATKYGYLKDNCELNFKFLNNLQPEWKQYATMMRQNKNLMDSNIDALYNILMKNQGDVNDAMGSKKKTVVVTSDPLAFIVEKTKVSKSKEKVVSSDFKGSDADDFSELKKITALLAKAFNRRKFYSKPINNNLRTSSTSQSANNKQEFVKTDNKKVEKKDDEKKQDISRVKCYNCKKEGHFAKDCKKVKMKSSSDSDQEINANIVFMAQIGKVLSDLEATSSSADEKIFEIADQEVLYDKMSVQLVELDKQVRDLKNSVLEKNFKISELAECVRNKDLEIENFLERLNICENRIHKMGKINQTLHMIMPSKDNLYNGRKGIGFENSSYFEKAKDLGPMLYDEKVIGLGYTPMLLTHSDEALEIKKFKRSRENKIEFAYDYRDLNASYVNEKINFEDDYFQEIINQDFEKIDSQFQQTSSLKLYFTNVILKKIIIDLEDDVVNLLSRVKRLVLNQKIKVKMIVLLLKKSVSKRRIQRMNNLLDDNNFFIFDDESVKISPVSKMPFRKKPRDSMNIVQICLWIIDSGCSKHMTGHNLFSVGKFCDKGLEVAFRKSTCFVRNEDGVDLLTGDRSSNLYTIALNEVASNSLTCLLAKASSS